jgi:hypothetical protein
MSTLKKFGILAASTVLCIPFLQVQSRIEVDVNWSIQEAAPTDHTVTIQDLSFTIPAGQSVKQQLQLKGGGSAAAAYAVRGWGFIGQQLKVDGKEVPLDRIKTANKRGALRILGFGRAPAMDAKIVM